MKKFIGIFVLIALFVFIKVVYDLVSKDYQIDYKINNIYIKEQYNSQDKYYFFVFETNKNKFEYLVHGKYSSKKKVIESVSYKNNCITFKSDIIENNSVCKNNKEYETYFYNDNVDTPLVKTYENINIYDTSKHTYYLWNYDRFLVFKNNKVNEIKLFNKDVYNLDIGFKYDDYLVVADYDNEYYFNKFILINNKNMKVSSKNLDRNIYYDSYYMGTNNGYIYLFDRQEEQEYKIDFLLGEVNKNINGYYIGDKWNDLSTNKLLKNDITFINDANFYYSVINNELFYVNNKYKTKVTNIKVDKLVYFDNNEAFFITDNILYKVNIIKGISKVLEYTEWKYNKNNIFVF